MHYGRTVRQRDVGMDKMSRKYDAILPHGHADALQRLRIYSYSQRQECVFLKIDGPERISPRSIGQVNKLFPLHDPAGVQWIFRLPVGNERALFSRLHIDDPDFALLVLQALDK